ncbi:MAG TPA: PhoPQ-activated protein PqaA family protein [Abditibacterium sp.]
MNPKFLPLMLLALTGCRDATLPASAQNETAEVAPAAEIKRDTPLDKYLARPETAYSWQNVADGEFMPGDGNFNLRLTSQTWQGKPWTHRLQIFKPDNLRHPDAAILNVSFGSGSLPESILGHAMANATGAYVVNVFNVPNQPLFGKTEDELVAHTFAKYLETGDETWPLLFPMTKSVTKSMDALEEWSEEAEGGKISKFIVFGASKRGWTTYLVAAGDPRVVGAVPIIYNNLDLPAQIAHQRDIWGETSRLAGPYARAGLFGQEQSEAGQKLLNLIDPYALRARLTMPKLLVHASNDGYWPLTGLDIYRAKLPGKTDVFNVPNAPHSLGNNISAVVGSVAAWSRLLLDGKSAPKVELKVEKTEDGQRFSLSSDDAPTATRLWIASANSKDFREAKWKSVDLEPRDGAYRATVSNADLYSDGAKYAQAFAEIAVAAEPLPLRLSSDLWQGEKN